METRNPHDAAFELGDADTFTGEVRIQQGLADAAGNSVAVVHFAAGARSHWHRHPGGQFLYGMSGRGRVRSRDGRGQVIAPGIVVHTPAGEWHYHGGGPDSPMSHVGINLGGGPEWGDPVTDAEYGEGFTGDDA
jgi:quercetin dioxygenase-like cupin family protein